MQKTGFPGQGPEMAGVTGQVFEWIRQNEVLLQYLGALSLATFILTPLVVWALIVRIPQDYFFCDRDHYREMARGFHPVPRFLFHAAKNAAGGVFLVAGLAMLVLPGQGVIMILAGLTLLDFPGKRALELRIVRRKKVLSSLNWVRTRAGKPPLKVRRKG